MNNEDLRQPDNLQHVPTVTTNSGPATGERKAELRELALAELRPVEKYVQDIHNRVPIGICCRVLKAIELLSK